MWAIDVYDKWRLVWFCYRHCISWVDRLSNRCSHFDYSTVNLNTNLQIYRVNLFTFKGCFRMRRMLHGCSTSVKQRIDNTYKQQLVNKRVSSLACCNVCRRNATNMVSYSVYRTRYFNTKNHCWIFCTRRFIVLLLWHSRVLLLSFPFTYFIAPYKFYIERYQSTKYMAMGRLQVRKLGYSPPSVQIINNQIDMAIQHI